MMLALAPSLYTRASEVSLACAGGCNFCQNALGAAFDDRARHGLNVLDLVALGLKQA